MVQIIYMISENNEIKMVQNFQYNNIEEAKRALEETYKDILGNNKISKIKYTDKQLKFANENVENHSMFIKE